MTCKTYRPDHNGECLTCDEPYDAHQPANRQLVGWTKGDGSGHEGYAVEHYYDDEGRYLGPDSHGIEPIFADEEE